MSDKATALKMLEDEYQNLLKAIAKLDNAQSSQTWLDGWSVKEIIAHVLGWEREMIVLMQRMARGERPLPEGVDYSDPDAWNAKFAAEMAPMNANTVVAIWQQTHMNFVRAAKALPDDRFGENDEGKPKTANRILEGNGYEHYREHAAQINEWRQREGL